MKSPRSGENRIGYILYIIFHFINDYKTNSLDSLTRFQTRANEPKKLGGLRLANSLAGDYFSPGGKISYPQVYFHLLRFILRATHFVVDSMGLRVDKRATPTQIGLSEMEKLLAAFVTEPTDANRKRLQSHLQKHLMAICLASPAQIAFLTANGFKI